MLLITLLTLAIKVIEKRAEEKPEGGFKTPEGRISFAQAIDELEKLRDWTHPTLNGSKVIRVISCIECHWHVKGIKTHSVRGNQMKHCSIFDVDTPDDHFCKRGMEKWEEDNNQT